MVNVIYQLDDPASLSLIPEDLKLKLTEKDSITFKVEGKESGGNESEDDNEGGDY